MQTITISVQGMTCGGCTSSVERALKRLDGVAAARAELKPGQVTVDFDPGKVDADELVQAIEDAGYEVPERATVD